MHTSHNHIIITNSLATVSVIKNSIFTHEMIYDHLRKYGLGGGLDRINKIDSIYIPRFVEEQHSTEMHQIFSCNF